MFLNFIMQSILMSNKISIGVDIEDISRFTYLVKDKSFLNKVFTKNELEYCLKKKNYSQHLAVRFAAKEAIIKAFSDFNKLLEFNEISITNDKDGKPIVKLKNQKDFNIKISLSHNKNNAIAFVLILKIEY